MPVRIMTIDPSIPTVSTTMAITSSSSDIPRSPSLARCRALRDRMFGDSDILFVPLVGSSVPLYPIATAVAGPNLNVSARGDGDRSPIKISSKGRFRQKHHEALTGIWAGARGHNTRKSARIKTRVARPRNGGETQAAGTGAAGKGPFVGGAAAGSDVDGDLAADGQERIADGVRAALGNIDKVCTAAA